MHTCPIEQLPDELLLLVFFHIGQIIPRDEKPWYIRKPPYRVKENQPSHRPGLRAYPFLGQVCHRWLSVLTSSEAQVKLWKEVVLDFGHELITAIHTPLKWSNARPTDMEFKEAFSRTTLSSAKIINFVANRRSIVKSIRLSSSEGYWSDDGEFVSLENKHNFGLCQLGMVLGLLMDTLQELCICHCNDLLAGDETGLWSTVVTLRELRVLRIEDLQVRVHCNVLNQLSQLRHLHTLAICGEEQCGVWTVGLDGLPDAWAGLTSLQRLELRYNSLLVQLPPWMGELPNLHHLDISYCSALDLSSITLITNLETLELQGLAMMQPPKAGEQVAPEVRCLLPSLAPLHSLTALSLASNCLTLVPTTLAKLTNLVYLDLSANAKLQIPSPLTQLMGLTRLAVVDTRGIHHGQGSGHWSGAKCTSMEHLMGLARVMRDRPFPTKVLFGVP